MPTRKRTKRRKTLLVLATVVLTSLGVHPATRDAILDAVEILIHREAGLESPTN